MYVYLYIYILTMLLFERVPNFMGTFIFSYDHYEMLIILWIISHGYVSVYTYDQCMIIMLTRAYNTTYIYTM